ncbi:hypothetical protein D3C75_1207480 [compost metagenome]
MILIDQPVSYRDCLLRFTSIIALYQLDFFPFNPPGRIDVCGSLRGPTPVLIPIGGIWAGEWPGDANNNFSLGIKCRTKITDKHSSERTFNQFQ